MIQFDIECKVEQTGIQVKDLDGKQQLRHKQIKRGYTCSWPTLSCWQGLRGSAGCLPSATHILAEVRRDLMHTGSWMVDDTHATCFLFLIIWHAKDNKSLRLYLPESASLKLQDSIAHPSVDEKNLQVVSYPSQVKLRKAKPIVSPKTNKVSTSAANETCR